MSKETSQWLNTMTLIGNTATKGHAWHYAEAMQGDEPNHYPGPIPVADVIRRLFGWQAVPLPMSYEFNGETRGVPGARLWVASDTGDPLSRTDKGASAVHAEGFSGHQYAEWLVDNVAAILNGTTDLGIGSAGLLRNRGQAWVSVERPESLTIEGTGIAYRPNIVACTSFDGSIATSYFDANMLPVCDNTLYIARGEGGNRFKIKHTRYSGMRIADAQAALGIMEASAEAFEAEVRELLDWTVDADAWAATLDVLVPVEANGKPLEGRGLTLAEHKRDTLNTLYANDNRVAPWAGTAFGVVQAFNTFNHHAGTIRGDASRVQRNREYVLSGKMAEWDAATLNALSKVTSN